MDGATVWEILKTVISWAWIPIGAYMTYKNNRDNRTAQWQITIEQRLTETEASTKVHEIQIQSIKETLKETKESIKEVKSGIDKLIDRLIK